MPQPEPLRHLLYAAALLALIDGAAVVALLLLCYFLYKAYRVTSNRLFIFFFLGFATLTAGEMARVLLLLSALAAGARGLLLFFLVHNAGPLPQLFQTLALVLIALGYAVEVARSRTGGEALAVTPLFPLVLAQRLWSGLFILLSFLNMALLLFILLNAVVVHLASRSRRTLLPVVAFSLMLVSNILLLPSVALGSEELFVLSKVVHLAGLLVFLALAVEVARA